jgi:hypothetical protein
MTLEFDWKVLRRYSDFLWLRNTLIKFFPGYLIPPLPKKKIMKKLDDAHLIKRMRSMEAFLINISRSKELRNTNIFFDFLAV